MNLTFQVKAVNTNKITVRHSDLEDVNELGLSKNQYVTSEELASEFRMTKENLISILESKSIEPIAKIISREEPDSEHELGKPRGGRPKLAFSPSAARFALMSGVEERYGARD